MISFAKKVLVVEDEEKIMNVVQSFLESKGFLVVGAGDGKKALAAFEQDEYSMVLLDLMLPLLSGEEVCRQIRRKSNVPIIMLTAKSDEADLLKGLGIGADDYITKPFSLKALYARIEAVLRRAGDDLIPVKKQQSFRNNDLFVDFESYLVKKAGSEVRLTPNEFKILATLIKYPNKVFTRDELIGCAFGNGFEGYDRTIDSHVKNLRQKLEDDPRNPVYLKTIHGVGYKFGGE